MNSTWKLLSSFFKFYIYWTILFYSEKCREKEIRYKREINRHRLEEAKEFDRAVTRRGEGSTVCVCVCVDSYPPALAHISCIKWADRSIPITRAGGTHCTQRPDNCTHTHTDTCSRPAHGGLSQPDNRTTWDVLTHTKHILSFSPKNKILRKEFSLMKTSLNYNACITLKSAEKEHLRSFGRRNLW